MEKLELRHLAPYLPYALMIATSDKLMASPRLMVDGIESKWASETNSLTIWQVLNNRIGFKPLLIPLSELTEEFIRQFNWAYVDNVISHVKNGAIDIKTWNALVEAHFDVFGLIDAGLALNKLNYEVKA